MSVIDDVLQDLPELYPGLERPDIERVLALTNQGPSEGSGRSIATALKPLLPDISTRLLSMSGDEITEYLRLLKGAATLTLQQWKADGDAPDADEIHRAVADIDD